MLETLETKKSSFKPLYEDDLSLKEKIEKVAKEIYGADGVTYAPAAERELKRITDLGMDKFPVLPKKPAAYQIDVNDDGVITGLF